MSEFKGECSPGAVSLCRDCLHCPGNKPSPKSALGFLKVPWGFTKPLQEALGVARESEEQPGLEYFALVCVCLTLGEKAKFVCKSK